jgi:hypothetical protein
MMMMMMTTLTTTDTAQCNLKLASLQMHKWFSNEVCVQSVCLALYNINTIYSQQNTLNTHTPEWITHQNTSYNNQQKTIHKTNITVITGHKNWDMKWKYWLLSWIIFTLHVYFHPRTTFHGWMLFRNMIKTVNYNKQHTNRNIGLYH